MAFFSVNYVSRMYHTKTNFLTRFDSSGNVKLIISKELPKVYKITNLAVLLTLIQAEFFQVL